MIHLIFSQGYISSVKAILYCFSYGPKVVFHPNCTKCCYTLACFLSSVGRIRETHGESFCLRLRETYCKKGPILFYSRTCLEKKNHSPFKPSHMGLFYFYYRTRQHIRIYCAASSMSCLPPFCQTAPHSKQPNTQECQSWGLEHHLVEFPEKSSLLPGGHIYPIYHLPWKPGLSFQSIQASARLCRYWLRLPCSHSLGFYTSPRTP